MIFSLFLKLDKEREGVIIKEGNYLREGNYSSIYGIFRKK